MSEISTHILDLSAGRPAAGVAIVLETRTGSEWKTIGGGVTDADGRLRDMVADGGSFEEGTYRLTFDTGKYFQQKGSESFYPHVVVAFTIPDASQNYHFPLLLSPFGYSTYRGS